MDNNLNSKYLADENLIKLMLKFSVPCVLSLLVGSFYNIVDQIFIGNSELSTLGNAATGVVFPVFIIAQAFAWCFGDGCAAYINICQGRNDSVSLNKVIGTCISITVISSFLLMGLMYSIKYRMLYLFGASDNSIAYAVEYLDIILIFLPFFMLSNMLSGVIRADGSPKTAMMSLIVGAVINIILDPIFIFAFKWGMFGAALATGIGQFASFVISCQYFFRSGTFKLDAKSFVPGFRYFRGAFDLGFSTFLTQMTVLVIVVLSNILFAKYGAASEYGADIPIAMMAIHSKLITIVLNIVVGVILGCQPIVSYNMGAGNYERIKKTYKYMILFALMISSVATLIFQLFPRAVIGIFGTPDNIPNPEDYWEFGIMICRVFLMLVILTSVTKVNSIFFQSAGKPVYALIASMLRDLFFFVPLAIILPRFFGVNGIIYAAPISDIVAAVIAVILITKFFKNLGKEQNYKL